VRPVLAPARWEGDTRNALSNFNSWFTNTRASSFLVVPCRDAGVPGRILHDFRRTAVRNLERPGVSRSAAMKLTGHKTESVYRRYAIVAGSDCEKQPASSTRPPRSRRAQSRAQGATALRAQRERSSVTC